MAVEKSPTAALLQTDFETVLNGWLKAQAREGVKRADLVSAKETEQQSRELLGVLSVAMENASVDDSFDFRKPAWDPLRATLEEVTESRTQRGVTPAEMGWFIASIKQPLFDLLQPVLADDPEAFTREVWNTTRVVDQIVLLAVEYLVQKREAVIARQQAEMTEVSAPVVKIWDRIVTVPLIGTLDSFRAQAVMENLLDSIVEWEAEVAIIDITGVSTVDTLVAQHLLKTAAAVRLMGAECVICGIRPKIAQTIVNLGVELPNIVTRVDLQSGLAYAFERIGVSTEEG